MSSPPVDGHPWLPCYLLLHNSGGDNYTISPCYKGNPNACGWPAEDDKAIKEGKYRREGHGEANQLTKSKQKTTTKHQVLATMKIINFIQLAKKIVVGSQVWCLTTRAIVDRFGY